MRQEILQNQFQLFGKETKFFFEALYIKILVKPVSAPSLLPTVFLKRYKTKIQNLFNIYH